jgi:DNA-binding transcriptional LysR family regulator
MPASKSRRFEYGIMDLRHLRYFVAVAEEEHITRAAERLGLQQPPLSQQIRSLERELDVQLFRRKPRGVELTEAGGALLDDARAILARVDQAVATARRTARGEQGRIAVGFTSSAPFHPFVGRVIRTFRHDHPRIALTLEEGNGGELLEALRTQKVDAAFIRSQRAVAQELVREPMVEERMVVALPTGHPLARSKRNGKDSGLPLRELAGETFIVFGQEIWPGLYEPILAACKAAGFTPNVDQRAPRVLSALNLVAAGIGICIVPTSLQRLHMDGLSFRPIMGRPQITAPLNLIFRRGEASAAVRRFIEQARRTAKAFEKPT